MPVDAIDGTPIIPPRIAPEDVTAIVHEVNSLEQLAAVLKTLPLRSTLVTPLDLTVTRVDGTDLVSISHRSLGCGPVDDLAHPFADDGDAGC